MPMLPSGRHVAILLTPLKDLLDDALDVFKVHKVLGIQQNADIYSFTEVIWLIPDELATTEQVEKSFMDGSLPRPPGLVPVLSGYRLAQFNEFSVDWSEEDKQAFWEFINGRAASVFEDAMDRVTAVQGFLRKQTTGMTQFLAACWDEGVHPAQEGYQIQEWERPEWDTYDMLAALGQMVYFLSRMDLDDRLQNDFMRLSAFWQIYSREMPMPVDWPSIEVTPRTAAQAARDEKWLDSLAQETRTTVHRQCVHECVMLWDHLGERLQAEFTDCAKIIDLVVVSADAHECHQIGSGQPI